MRIELRVRSRWMMVLHWLRSIVVPRALCPRHRRWGMINGIHPRRHWMRCIILNIHVGHRAVWRWSPHSIAIPTLWWRWRVMHLRCLIMDLARLGCSKIILLARWRTICWHCIWWKVVPSIWRSLVKTAIYITNISARRNTPSWESIWRWTAWQKTIR